MSTCRSWSRARRGPRLTPRTLPVRPVASAAGRSASGVRAAAGRDGASAGRAAAGGTVTAWVASTGSGPPARTARLVPVTGGAAFAGFAEGPSGVTGWAAGGAGVSVPVAGAFAGVAAGSAAGPSGIRARTVASGFSVDAAAAGDRSARAPAGEPTAVAPAGDPPSCRSRGASSGAAASGTPSDVPDPLRVPVRTELRPRSLILVSCPPAASAASLHPPVHRLVRRRWTGHCRGRRAAPSADDVVRHRGLASAPD
ncbi:protein of unknown function [Modestobacter italicus]|uniref:Uncharacterized protein n=1 Tax=Modestobacter italicus (strain DSM 44449 / CECT 9708 / BC 501) TaxID=2732864 RepID=I4EQ21_MODI5|nr:protein of unknown function [Modestobacter marinus]